MNKDYIQCMLFGQELSNIGISMKKTTRKEW